MSILSTSQPSNFYPRLLAIVFSFGVALGSGLGYGFSQVTSTTKQELPPQTKQCNDISPVKYERLKVGMSLTEVQVILGSSGTEVDKTATTANIIWENSNGYKIITTFENDKLKSKKQSSGWCSELQTK